MSKEKKNLTPFGRKIKFKCLEKNIKQKALAEMVGASESYLCQIIYGIRNGDKYLKKIAEILEIDMNEFG